MIYIILLLIIFIGNDSFTLLPWYHIKGVFRLSDIGLLLIILTLAHQFYRSKNHKIVFNGAGWLIFGYLVMSLMHVANASVNYNQSILSGLIQSRHEFYYLSYFLFLLVLSKPGKAEVFMKYFSWLALFIAVISFLNYIKPGFFHHRWGEGQGVRLGVTRAFVPGLDVIGMAFLWYMLKYLMKGTFINKGMIGVFVLFLAILMRQTRGRIIAVVMAAGWMMFRERKYKMMVYSGFAAAILVLVMGMVMKENILVSSFESAYTDVTEQEGTWVGRMATLQNAWDTFREHPVIGSGSQFIRQSEPGKITQEALVDAYQGDLGYAHWLKNFGIIGVIWLVSLVLIGLKRSAKNRKEVPNDLVAKIGEYQLAHIALGFVTINYLGNPSGVIVFCLALALLHCRQYEVSSTNEEFREKSSHIEEQAPAKIIKKKSLPIIKYADSTDNNE